ncbi:MAG: FAD-dependent oxidoreductase [Phycisphaeraceae bacterium]|nr:FAD-dependent oxidoreductase [Phycisphaeraceae bacterium]
MPTRRQFISGCAALSAGWLARGTFGAPRLIGAAFSARPDCPDTGAFRPDLTHPFRAVPNNQPTFTVGGVRFAAEWFGDWFPNDAIPFHHTENVYPGGEPPAPTETVNVAIIGGGLSGLASAYLLRDLDPVILELQPRFGGTSQGETWRGTPFSLGGAYFIVPDEGSFLERFYRELGLQRTVRVSPSTDDPVEVNGSIDPAFWDGPAGDPVARLAFEQYRALVAEYADHYPDIPLDPDADNQWIIDLDTMSLKDHIESRLLVPVPDTLRAAIQGYCWSSFDAGWEGVSAAAGWNFIAAEEYGRWVLPGGNAGLVSAMWERLRRREPRSALCPASVLRAGCRAIEVRLLNDGHVLVVYKDRTGAFRSLRARRAVVACPKHVARHLLPDLANDPLKVDAFSAVHTASYVVANVLLSRRVRRDWYDLFLLRDGNFPPESNADQAHRPTDAVNGGFARGPHPGPNVLTFYWPLPFAFSRFAVIEPDAMTNFAQRFVQQIDPMLAALGADRGDIDQVRLARWGHAMPLARPFFIANGHAEHARRPIDDRIFFVHQDNWALPAVETCLLEAKTMTDRIRDGW